MGSNIHETEVEIPTETQGALQMETEALLVTEGPQFSENLSPSPKKCRNQSYKKTNSLTTLHAQSVMNPQSLSCNSSRNYLFSLNTSRAKPTGEAIEYKMKNCPRPPLSHSKINKALNSTTELNCNLLETTNNLNERIVNESSLNSNPS